VRAGEQHDAQQDDDEQKQQIQHHAASGVHSAPETAEDPAQQAGIRVGHMFSERHGREAI